MTNANDISQPSEAILAMVRGEITSKRRWMYRLFLLGNSVVLAAVLSLWCTEPGPLPMRLHVGFGLIVGVAVGWVGVLIWILTRKNCPTAIDRLATAWMATIASCGFLIVGLTVSLMRAKTSAAIWLGLTGTVFVVVAITLLRNAYALRAELRSKLENSQVNQ